MTARPQQQRSLHQEPQLFLRIRHPSMDPREITRALAIEPLQTLTCGSSVEGAVRRLHTESYWIAQLPTSPMSELLERYRGSVQGLSTITLNQEDFPAVGGGEWDVRIMLQLRELQVETRRALLQQIIREGGSVALLIDRGEERSPFVIQRAALAKLAELGIELEID